MFMAKLYTPLFMLCQHSSRINISQLEIIPNRDYGERQIPI